ncbi:MAG: alpha-galactosidase [Clostridia bacterium]|nr:alpha-galactosidase [Clostridia bacterium]
MEQKKLLKGVAAAAGAGTAAAAAAVLGVKMKKQEFCPVCTAKRAVHKLWLNQTAANRYNNGAALTPPMGWSSWNLFATHINEDLIKQIADAMDRSGLREAGYQYVNIDDCWQSSARDENGRLQCDKATFPGGIKALADYVNARGLKLGIYSSNGTWTCEDYPGSLRHEAIDADTFASWGIEYFKYDFCHNVPISEKAPRIRQIELSRPGEGACRVFSVDDVTLSGRARIVKDEAIGHRFITGLCSRAGSFALNTEAEEAGDYVLTFLAAKADDAERFVRITVNGRDEYHVYCTKGRMPLHGERRIQTTVRLQQGVNTLVFDNPVGSRFDSAAVQYKLMGRELKRATKEYAEKNGVPEKPIVYSICEWGFNRPWKWGAEAGNLWRTTGDIKPTWVSILALYEWTVRLWKHAGKGGWNDPDMLEVGNGKLTHDENRSHFSLWCMMNAPLILGNDVRAFVKEDGSVDADNKILQILTNKDMIAVNQDPLGVPCRRIKAGTVDVLLKPLSEARAAVCVFNKTSRPANTALDCRALANEGFVNLPGKAVYTVRDVWDGTETTCDGRLNAATAPHGVKVYIIG